MYDLGDVVPLGVRVTDASGALVDAGSMALTITLPDQTTVTADPVAPASTGTYSYDYATAQAGRHIVRWVATGANAMAQSDVFDVRPADPQFLFSLADGKKHLNIAATSTGDDEELRDWIAATTMVVEHFVGPCARRTVTERHSFSVADVRVLRHTPALALTSVVPVLTSGTTYNPVDLDLDEETGIVQRKDGGLLYGPLRFTYTAGRAVITPNISAAGRIILQHLWETQRGAMGGVRLGGGNDFSVSEPIPGLGYAVPNRALELLEPDRTPPGVA
ncbi:hypothetical protein ACFSL4_01770 [Streptomyces caeni]|uniref:Uncharacterized protein n=1 Tax=Streptomyces caeni TaxID=2307231 RepID=A0ABW4IK00_9ACTN